MSPRKFARRSKVQPTVECNLLQFGSACQNCARAHAGTPCQPSEFHAHNDCRIMSDNQNGYSHFPFMVIDANSYHVRLANLATGIRVPLKEIKCHELSHKRSQPCGDCDYSCPMADVKQNGRSVTARHDHFHSSGEKKAYQIHAHPVFDTNGEVIQIIEYAFQANGDADSGNLPEPIERYVLPIVRTLTDKKGAVDPEYVTRLADCLDDNLPEPRDSALKTGLARLKTDERAMCKMMYHDLSSREMALLSGKNLSQINNKRRRIRQKLGLAQSPVNLNHYLQTRW